MNFLRDISVIKYPLGFLGLWPEDSSYTKIKFTITFSLIFIGAIVNIRHFFYIKSELELMETITYSLAFTTTAIGISVMKMKRLTMHKILIWMNENWRYYKYLPKKCQQAMDRQSVNSKRLIIIVYIVLLLKTIFFIVGPLVISLTNNMSITKVSNEAWFPFAIEHPVNIGIIYIIRSLAIVYCIIALNNLDFYIILTVLHICGQIKIICDIINTFNESVTHTETTEHTEELHYCNCLQCIVDRHNSIVEVIEALEDCVNIIIISKLFVHGIQICVLGFLLIAGKTNVTSKLATMIFYVIEILWSSFIYGWLGDQLTQHGYAIGNAVYSNNWYEYRELKTRQRLSVIICRAQRPIHITAGKYFSMSLKAVGELFATWMSYLSVLYAVKSSQK